MTQSHDARLAELAAELGGDEVISGLPGLRTPDESMECPG